MKKFNIYTIVTLLFFSFTTLTFAAQVSQQQMEQFKQLPKAQQEQLARSMGIDINAIQSQMGTQNITDEPFRGTPVYDRDTVFDLEGNPIEEEEKEKIKEELFGATKLEPFGYDIFANGPSTFSPTHDIAIPEGYMIGTGDKISVQIFGKENSSFQLVVSRQGDIVVPSLGPFKVAGLTFSEMKLFLTEKIKQRILGVEAVVAVDSLRSMRVFVLGEAYKPGPYTLSSLSSITHAIFASGGVSDIGSLRNIQLKRSGKVIQTFDLYELLINGDSSKDVLLQSGDVVFIAPVGKTVKIEGMVRRPGIYELSGKETFEDVIDMAGGSLPSAYLKSAMVERYSDNSYLTAMNLDLSDADDLMLVVRDGDHIRLKKTTDQYEESITLIGAATRPGKYQWSEDIKVSDIIKGIDSHLLISADLNYSLVVREINKARDIEILQFSLAEAIAGLERNDLALQPNDKIIVFSKVSTLREEKITLDSLAHTQEELFALEKKYAMERFESDSFWKRFGGESKHNTNSDDDEKVKELANKSIDQLAGEKLEEGDDVSELSLFSRQRLLAPIVERLRRQVSNTKPLALVEVDGEVKFPGIYPLSVNARVKDLILAAGGIEESAYTERAELTRNLVEGIEARKHSKNIRLSGALAGDDDENLVLMSKDRLNVHRIPSWSENHVVELVGEVMFPGRYTIRRGDTMSSLIEKAGGFTKYAHVEGAFFTREKLKELERKNLIKLASDLRIEMASKSLTENGIGSSYAEAQSLLADLSDVEPIGRLVIELPKVMLSNDYDVLLEGGDKLIIPTFKNSVNVIGQVQVTSSHMYDESIGAIEYIAQSGGMKKRADDDRIYVIGADGRIRMMESGWFAGDSKVNPGDTVVVPLDSEYMNNLTLWSTATQIIYNSAVALAAINGIGT